MLIWIVCPSGFRSPVVTHQTNPDPTIYRLADPRLRLRFSEVVLERLSMEKGDCYLWTARLWNQTGDRSTAIRPGELTSNTDRTRQAYVARNRLDAPGRGT